VAGSDPHGAAFPHATATIASLLGYRPWLEASLSKGIKFQRSTPLAGDAKLKIVFIRFIRWVSDREGKAIPRGAAPDDRIAYGRAGNV